MISSKFDRIVLLELRKFLMTSKSEDLIFRRLQLFKNSIWKVLIVRNSIQKILTLETSILSLKFLRLQIFKTLIFLKLNIFSKTSFFEGLSFEELDYFNQEFLPSLAQSPNPNLGAEVVLFPDYPTTRPDHPEQYFS